MVVPVWVGSGIRTKILAAWWCRPVVTTSVGVEGLPGTSGEHFVVADEASGFSDACVELSGDVVKLNRIAANGLHLVQEHYSLAAVRKTRLSVYEELLAAGWGSSSKRAPRPIDDTAPQHHHPELQSCAVPREALVELGLESNLARF